MTSHLQEGGKCCRVYRQITAEPGKVFLSPTHDKLPTKKLLDIEEPKMTGSRRILLSVVVATLTFKTQACLTRSGPKVVDDLKISHSPGPESAKVTSLKLTQGHAPYSANGKPQKVSWFMCQIASPAGAVILAHDEAAGFDSATFCDLPEAQAFLAAGFHVAGFNRPGFGASTGERDLVGKQSQQAALVAAKETLRANSGLNSAIVGAYGFGTGAAAASFFSKQSGNLQWLIAGGGIHDFEQAARTSSDGGLTSMIKKTTDQEGEVAYETRSIAYDVNGLPPRIAIFQGADDTVAPADQANSFRDSLAASQCKVTFQEIKGINHQINPNQIRQILDVMIASAKKPKS